jgi:Tubulin-tyrosine ligase family
MNSSTEPCWPFQLMLLGVFLGLVAFDYLITVEDCLSTNNAGVILANIAPEASNHFFQPNAEIVASNVLFQASPPGYDKSYFMPCGKACHPIARALRELGWQKLNEPKNARLIHLDDYDKETGSSLETYQRFNHLEDSVLLAESKEFWSIMKQYKKTNARGRSVSFLPNTYRMSVDHERRAFERLVTDGVAKLTPWIATIKKYSRKKIIPSHAKLLKRYQSSKMTSKQIMQKYICDQMIWNHRQFVVRVFWLVRTY